MKQYFSGLVYLIFLLSSATMAKAQDAPEKNEQPDKVITVGSHVLKQDGTDEYAYNNGPYHYEKVWEVPGVSKDELYGRAKKWVLSNLKAGDQNQLDDKDKNEIHTATLLFITQDIGGMRDQKLSFKLNFYFKEGKYRLEVGNFVYTGMAANPRNTPLNNLNTPKYLTKKEQNKIYDAFDAIYLTLIRSLKEAMKKGDSSNW